MKNNRRNNSTYIAAGASTAPCRSFDRAQKAKGLISAALSIVALTAPLALHAQSLSFAGAQTAVPIPEGYYRSVAVDKAGDVFIASVNNSTGNSSIVKVTPAGVQSTLPVSGLSYQIGQIALDSAGDLFIADTFNGRVVEYSAAGVQTTVVSGMGEVSGVAVDGHGNIFISQGSYDPEVLEFPAGGGKNQPKATFSPFISPNYLAVDGAGDLFIADTGNDSVGEFAWTGSSYGPETSLGGGLNQPNAVAVDGEGNVFIADTGNNQVVEVPWTGSSYGAQITVPAIGLYSPIAVAVDSADDLLFVNRNYSQVAVIEKTYVPFGAVNICSAGQTTPAPCNQSVTLNYTIDDSTTIASVNVVTQGAPNLDFTLGSTTCTGAQTAGSTCRVTATFAPTAPGLRTGAVQLTGNSGNVLVSTPGYGTGQGPAIAFQGSQTTVLASGLNDPWGAAVDAAGNVFIADNHNNRVVEVSANGGTQITLPVNGLNNPQGVAVDGAGDLFIADFYNSRVVELPWTGSGYGAQTTLPTNGLNCPEGVAVDGKGDVFIADYFNARVVELPWTGSGYGTQTTVSANGLSYPKGVAVDTAGDIFIADSGNNRVVEVPLTGSGYGTQTTVPANGLNNPQGVAVDAAGDVYITDTANDRVVEVPANSGAQITVPANGVSWPVGVAVDGKGDVFIANETAPGQVLEIQSSTPPSLSFAATPVGQTSSPQSFTIQNIGNQPLNASGLSIGANFEQVEGSGTPEECTGSFSLTPGAECNVSISFEPTTVGSITSSAVLTDNALNGNPATQSVTLSGTSQQVAPTLSISVPSQFAPDPNTGIEQFTASATSNSPGAITYSVVSGPATISGNLATVTGLGTIVLQASQAASGDYAAATATTSVTINPAAPNLSFGSTYLTFPNSRSVGCSSNSSGAITLSVVSGPATISGNTLTPTGAGTVTLQCSQAAAGIFAAATVQGTATVEPAIPQITFSVPNQTYPAAPFTVSATSNSPGAITYSVISGPATISGNTVTLTGTGTVELQASQAATTNYTQGGELTSFTVSAN